MSQEELYQWIKGIGPLFSQLGYWPMVGLALYSYGVSAARHSAPSRVAESWVGAGTPRTVQRVGSAG